MSPEASPAGSRPARAGRYPGKPAAVLPVFGPPLRLLRRLDAIRAVAGLPYRSCAQAHGAAYENRPPGPPAPPGRSLYPTKNLGAVGDGGCVVTSTTTPLPNIRGSVREYGWRTHYEQRARHVQLDGTEPPSSMSPPANCPPRTPNAARAGEIYHHQKLSGVPGLVLPTIPDARGTVYHLYVVNADRDEVQGGSATGAWALPSTSPSRCIFGMPTEQH